MTWLHILDANPHSINFDTNATSRVPLTEYRLITVTGPDSQKFLQGQCTCDFTLLTKDNFIRGAHCTPKGRMHSSFVAAFIDDEGTIGLRVHTSIAESALAALQKYAVFSKVTLSIAEDYFILGITGDAAAKSVNKLSTELVLSTSSEEGINTRSALNDNTLIALHYNTKQIEIWCKGAESLSSANLTLKDTPLQSNDNLWQLFEVQHGIGNVQIETKEALLPQEINFQYTEGVSFKKGCYTGQEIVARLHYRGQMKKHMYRASIEATQPPHIGSGIYGSDQPEKSRGSVINYAQAGHETYEILVLSDDALFEQEAHLKHEDFTAKIQWQALPYAIS